MTRVYQQPLSDGFIRSVGNGDISTDVITVKAAADTVYAAGTIMIAELDDTQTPTGKYIPLGMATITYPDPWKLAILRTAVDADKGDTKAIAITRKAEVYGDRILAHGDPILAATLTPQLAAQGIIVR